MPSKITLDFSWLGIPNWVSAMPAIVEHVQAYEITWAGGFIENSKKYNLPYILATLTLNDAQTGYPKAMMDAVRITNMRTGATAAVAVLHLARREASAVNLNGSEVQARTSLQALSQLLKLKEVRTADICPQSLRTWCIR